MTNLIDWRNFYVLISTAAATLIGLMFVATSLLVGFNRRYSAMNAGITSFNTPTMVHFCMVLLIGAVLVAPWHELQHVRIVLGLIGLGGTIYLAGIANRMRHIPDRQTPMHDWTWYLIFPLVGYVFLIIIAFVLPVNPTSSWYLVGLTTLTLLFVSLRNAWDLVTFLVLERNFPSDN